MTLEESARRAGIIWTGTDDGVVSVTRDAGKTWSNVTAKIRRRAQVDLCVGRGAVARSDGTAYVTFDGHRGGDYDTYVFATTDFGATSRSIAGNLPKGEVARTILEDPKNADLLYLGTETGLWVSLQPRRRSGRASRRTCRRCPSTRSSMHPRDNDLILATHARGVWILDDVGIIQQWAKAAAADTFAFEPEPAMAFNQANDQMKGFEGDLLFLGLNPAPGATLAYRLKSDAKHVKLDHP